MRIVAGDWFVAAGAYLLHLAVPTSDMQRYAVLAAEGEIPRLAVTLGRPHQYCFADFFLLAARALDRAMVVHVGVGGVRDVHHTLRAASSRASISPSTR